MKDDITTAKRLRNAAQGCRASRLPWVSGSRDNNPKGVASVRDLDERKPCRSTSTVSICSERRNPFGVCVSVALDPRVAAQRGNPGLR